MLLLQLVHCYTVFLARAIVSLRSCMCQARSPLLDASALHIVQSCMWKAQATRCPLIVQYTLYTNLAA